MQLKFKKNTKHKRKNEIFFLKLEGIKSLMILKRKFKTSSKKKRKNIKIIIL
jgi:hypothetical protein